MDFRIAQEKVRETRAKRAATKAAKIAAGVPDRPAGRYVTALLLIALLATLSTFVTFRSLARQREDTDALQMGLNQGLRARSISEMASAPLQFGSAPTVAGEMRKTIEEISGVHVGLVENGELGSASAALTTAVDRSVDPYQDMLQLAGIVIASLEASTAPPPSTVAELGAAAAAYDLALRSFVVQHQGEAESRVVRLGQTQYYLLVATLLLLLLEGLFLFRPAARKIRARWREQSVAHRYERDLDQQRMNYLARFDPLTGLINRTLFSDRLQGAVARARRDGSVLALLFLDIDGFKEVNDQYGHAVGDSLLRIAAERLVKTVRESDTVARLGGDEFTVILEGGSRVEDAGSIATKILTELAKPYLVGHHDLVVTTSIGIASFPLDGESAEELLKGADIAMYSAKAAGRNTYQFFTEELRERTTERLSLLDGLRKALDDEVGLRLVYQPKVDVQRRVVLGFEALLRWDHAEFGPVPPSRFVPLAEESDLIVPLGQWVLDRVCTQMTAWLEQGLPPMRVSVNLSSRQFKVGNLVESVAASLGAAALHPRYLDVELTEGTLITDVAQTRRSLERLRDMGVTVSIDDFGTGYSSLGYLTSFPIDTLKIDRSFIADTYTGSDGIAISSAIVGLARNLGLEVIAEGVETEEQLKHLLALGCPRVQGFLVSRPLDPSDVPGFVATFAGGNQLARSAASQSDGLSESLRIPRGT